MFRTASAIQIQRSIHWNVICPHHGIAEKLIKQQSLIHSEKQIPGFRQRLVLPNFNISNCKISYWVLREIGWHQHEHWNKPVFENVNNNVLNYIL